MEHFSELIGKTLEFIATLIKEDYHLCECKIVANKDGLVIDVLFNIGMNWYSFQSQMDFGFSGEVNAVDYHHVRHFDETGDCDFRYLIPLEGI